MQLTDYVVLVLVTCSWSTTPDSLLCENSKGLPLCYSTINTTQELMTSCSTTPLTAMDIAWKIVSLNNLQNVIFITNNTGIEDGRWTMLQTLSCDRLFSAHRLNLTSETVYPLPLVLNVVVDCTYYNVTQVMSQTLLHVSHGHRSLLSRPVINWIFTLNRFPMFDENQMASVMFKTDTMFTISNMPCSRKRPHCIVKQPLITKFEPDELELTDCYEYIVSEYTLTHQGHVTRKITGHASSLGDVSGLTEVNIPSTFTDFKGEHFYVATHNYFPFSYPVNGDVSNATQYAGYAIEVMTLIAEKHNFSFTLKYSRDHMWGGIGPDGRWNGLVGMVRDGDVDLTATGLTITPQRVEAVDFTVPFWGLVNGILIHTADREWFPFIRPFQTTVWLAYLGSAAVTTLCLWAVLLTYRQHFPSTSGDVWRPLKDCAMFIFGVAFLRSGEYKPRRGTTRFLIGSFWVMVTVVTATYSGNLMASLATERQKLPFTTLVELANQDEFVLVMRDGTSAAGLLKDATRGPYHTLWTKLMANPQNLYVTWAETEARMRTGKYATISDKIELSMRISDLGCSYHVLPDEFTPSGYGVALLRGSPFTRIFSNTITQALEGGMGRKWQNMFWPDDICAEQYKVSAKSKPTSLRSLYGLFFLFAGGLGLAIFALLFEILYKNPDNMIGMERQGYYSR